MPDSTFIRLAGPLQSWAGLTVSGNFVRSEPRPTLSALQGLLAGALGAKRGEWPHWIHDVHFTVREEKRAQFTNDFQTIGSREDEWNFRSRLAVVQQMKASSVKQLAFKPAVGATAIVRRTYLSEAEFLVRVTHEDHVEEIDHAFSTPKFSTYLGRKAFSATFPFYLGTGSSEFLSLIPTVKPDSVGDKTVVRIVEPLLGADAVASTEWVPCVETREEWLEAIQQLTLHRRCTEKK